MQGTIRWGWFQKGGASYSLVGANLRQQLGGPCAQTPEALGQIATSSGVKAGWEQPNGSWAFDVVPKRGFM